MQRVDRSDHLDDSTDAHSEQDLSLVSVQLLLRVRHGISIRLANMIQEARYARISALGLEHPYVRAPVTVFGRGPCSDNCEVVAPDDGLSCANCVKSRGRVHLKRHAFCCLP